MNTKKLDCKEDDFALKSKDIMNCLDELQIGQVRCLDELSLLSETVETLLSEMVNLRLECRHIWRATSRPTRYKRRNNNIVPNIRQINYAPGLYLLLIFIIVFKFILSLLIFNVYVTFIINVLFLSLFGFKMIHKVFKLVI